MRVPRIAADIPDCYEYDLLTTRPITDAELSNFQTLPGFIQSTMDLMEVIYAQGRTYTTNGNVNTFVTTDTNAWGSGQPTAMSKLHWTRVYIPLVAADASVLQTYSANLVVNALSAKEKDLVHLERLRRSYVLQG